MEHLQGLQWENLTAYHNIHFSCTSQFFSIITNHDHDYQLGTFTMEM